MKHIIITAALVIFLQFSLSAQKQNTPPPLSKGLTFYFEEDSSAFLKLIGLGQVTGRYMELNDGSIAPDGKIKSSDTDIMLMRVCLGGAFKYKRFQFFYLFGNSGMTIASGKQGDYYTYDAWGSYEIIRRKLIIGMGQSLHNGLSRYSSIMASQTLTPELSFLPVPTLAKGDQIARNLRLFATGALGNLEYKLSVVRPYTSTPGTRAPYFPNLENAPVDVCYDYPSDQFGVEGYFAYQFFDKENIYSSSRSFAYLGTKKVFNIGAGFEHQPDATASINSKQETVLHNTTSYSADSYLDLPLSNGGVFSSYVAYFQYNFGKNWIRSMGTMHYFTGGATPQGPGINEFTVGTGNAIYIEAGYLLPTEFTDEKHRLQLYATYSYKNYEALQEAMHQPTFGFNYYIAGHNAKVGLQYLLRPCYNNELKVDTYKNNALLQLQFAF